MTRQGRRSSCAIAVAHAQLVRCGALTYTPSLSWAVQDALFSYWRLPVAVKAAVRASQPRFELVGTGRDDQPIRMHVEWGSFLQCLEDVDAGHGAKSTECAWALALLAEEIFDEAVLPIVNDPSTVFATDGVVTHHGSLRQIIATQRRDKGKYYLGFEVMITVLERALYDIYHAHQARMSGERDVGAKKKNMILRDLLHSDILNEALPDGLIALLKILFLPSGLNLRNLVWHGFMIPAEFPRCFACLTTLILLDLPLYCKLVDNVTDEGSPDDEKLFRPHIFDTQFVLPEDVTNAFTLGQAINEELVKFGLSTRFIPKGRERLVQDAMQSLVRGDEVSFLFALLPVLEHALRVEFVRLNGSSNRGITAEYCVAQIDQYYSTLDGFGQRDKHQVLLFPDVVIASTERSSESLHLNALYPALPPAALSVCLDLFMMSSGPNIRAKLCHGEADLSGFRSPTLSSSISTASQLLLLTWISLCQQPRFRINGLAADSDLELDSGSDKYPLQGTGALLQKFETQVTSSFHPFVQLRRRVLACRHRLATFTTFRTRHTAFCVLPHKSDGDDKQECMSIISFLPDPEDVFTTTPQAFSMMESTKRLQDFDGLLNGTLAKSSTTSEAIGPKPRRAVPKITSFGALLTALHAQLQHVRAQLGHHSLCCSHADESRLVPDPEDACSTAIQWGELALSDADGLSVSACMMETLASIQRSLDTAEQRFRMLRDMVREGSARTNHRRSLLNLAFFLPELEAMQALCLEFVEHHYIQLAAIARQKVSKAERVAEVARCPTARAVEELQRKLLQFVTAFEGCTGSSAGAPKSGKKGIQLALQFFISKPVRSALGHM